MAAVEGQVPMLVTSPGIIELIGPRSLRVRIGISTAAPPCPSAEPVSIPVYVLRPSDTLDSPEPLYESLRAGPAASLSAASLLRAVSAKRCLGRATRGLPKLHVFPASRTSTTITATDIQVGIMLEPKSTNEQAAHAPNNNNNNNNGPSTPKTPVPITPHRPATLRPTGSTLRRTPARTPLRQRTPAPSFPAAPGSRPPPKSPHVIRAWETKRATTPGRERRKSARWLMHARERDSPMDILKKLSMNLAPTSRPFYFDATPKKRTPRTSLVKTSGADGAERRESVVFTYHSDPEGYGDEEDIKSPPPPPGLSLDPDARVDRENEEFARIPPPRLSGTPGGRRRSRSLGFGGGGGVNETLNESTLDGDSTMDSIELPRRAPPESYLSRMSFGIRLSDRFHDLDELGRDESMLDGDSSYGNGLPGVDADDSMMMSGGAHDQSAENLWEGLDLGDNTRDLRYLLEDGETGDITMAGGMGGDLDEESLGGFQLQVPGLGGDEVRDVKVEAGEADEDEEEEEREEEERGMAGRGRAGRAAASTAVDDYPGSPTQEDDYPGSPTQVDSHAYYDDDDDDDDDLPEPLDDNNLPEPHQIAITINQNHGAALPLAPLPRAKPTTTTTPTTTTKPPPRLSRHNLPVPSLPARLVKKLAANFSGGRKIPPDTLAQIMKASDAFFENASVRLGEFAGHAGRKTVGEGDVELLMKRQRHVNQQNTVFSLAEKYLPRELLQEIRMPLPAKAAGGGGVKKQKRGSAVGKGKGKGKAVAVAAVEEEEEDGMEEVEG